MSFAASMTGIPLLDCENPDFKIASDIRRVHVENFRKQVTTAEGDTLKGIKTVCLFWKICHNDHSGGVSCCSVLGCDHGGKSRAMRAVIALFTILMAGRPTS